jgi:HEAT repeat protein
MKIFLAFIAAAVLSVPAAARPRAKELIRRFEAASGDDRLRLAAALGRARTKAATDALLRAFDVERGSPREMTAIADALGAAGDVRADAPLAAADASLRALDAKLGGLTAPLQVLREAVLSAAGSGGGEACAAALRSALDDKDPRMVDAAARSLGRLQVKAAVPALEALAAGGGPAAQGALEALGDIGDKSAAEKIAPVATSTDAFVPVEAAYALVRLGRDGMAERLDAALKGAPGPAALAAYYLIKLDRTEGLDHLDGVLKKGAPAEAVMAAEALGKSGNPRAVLPLVDAAESTDSDVRAAAARGLGRLGGARALSALQTLRSDPNPGARSAALSALAALGEPD